MSPLEAIDVLEHLKNDDIGVRLDILPGVGGFDWYIGPKTLMPDTEWLRHGTAETFAEAVKDIAEAASRAYPAGDFATWWRERIKH